MRQKDKKISNQVAKITRKKNMGPDDLLCSVPPSPAVEVQEDIQRETENDRERQRGII